MAVADCQRSSRLSSLLWPNRVDIEVEQIGSLTPGLDMHTYLHTCLQCYPARVQHRDGHTAACVHLNTMTSIKRVWVGCLCTVLYVSSKLTLVDIASRSFYQTRSKAVHMLAHECCVPH